MEDPKAFRVAATVLVLRDDPFEVLMVRRNAQATFASRRVFPGGVIDPDDADEAWLPLVSGADDLEPDERALRICAIRETWEETSLLIGAEHAPASPTDVAFRDVVTAAGITLPLDRLHPFAHWITPDAEPRRFDTHFYLTRAPIGQIPVADGGETVELEWIAPAEPGDEGLMFPTAMNLERLAQSTDAASAIAAASGRAAFTVHPVTTTAPDGSVTLSIPAEAGYSVTEYLHR
jgi:8-oxo-dGTP pyrophosphatase MutT (NUDIX family)